MEAGAGQLYVPRRRVIAGFETRTIGQVLAGQVLGKSLRLREQKTEPPAVAGGSEVAERRTPNATTLPAFAQKRRRGCLTPTDAGSVRKRHFPSLSLASAFSHSAKAFAVACGASRSLEITAC